MMIDVHLTDGHTVFRMLDRARLVQLIKREPALLEQDRPLGVWLDRGQGEGFEPARLQYLRKHQISWVEQVTAAVRDPFLAQHAPAELERIRRKEHEHRASEPAHTEGAAA